MQLMIGDRSFIEVLQAERVAIADEAKIYMQEILDKYTPEFYSISSASGVVPPEPVADSFNEVNRAKQDQETLINEALQEYNRIIIKLREMPKECLLKPRVMRRASQQCKGDANLYESILVDI